ncbi:MAG: FHA domain-containing protein [Nannocystaceae bacterium]|nr:FHA domain-containing protein [Nannocystaceae bacterium]
MPTVVPRPILRIRSPVIGRGEQVLELGTNPIAIGRAEDCDVVLLEQSASRLHARLVPEAGGWVLVDEGSQGGVFFGAERTSLRRLRDGDEFRIGETTFQFVERPGSQPTLLGERVPGPSAAPREDHERSLGTAPTIASGTFPRPDAAEPAPRPNPPRPLEPPRAAVVEPPRAAVVEPPRAAVVEPPRAAAQAAAQAPTRAIAPPASAPSFVDFGPVGNPTGAPPVGSAPSFVDFGPVGRPDPRAADSSAFDGQLAADPSRIDRVESHRVGSRWGTWIIVCLLFVGLSLAVLALAFDIQISDLLSVFE